MGWQKRLKQVRADFISALDDFPPARFNSDLTLLHNICYSCRPSTEFDTREVSSKATTPNEVQLDRNGGSRRVTMDTNLGEMVRDVHPVFQYRSGASEVSLLMGMRNATARFESLASLALRQLPPPMLSVASWFPGEGPGRLNETPDAHLWLYVLYHHLRGDKVPFWAPIKYEDGAEFRAYRCGNCISEIDDRGAQYAMLNISLFTASVMAIDSLTVSAPSTTERPLVVSLPQVLDLLHRTGEILPIADEGNRTMRSEQMTPSSSPSGLKMKRVKRSTTSGDARAKIIAALTKHHQYDNRSCLNPEPIGRNALAELAGVSTGAVSKFFASEFKGHGKYAGHGSYAAACRRGDIGIALENLSGIRCHRLLSSPNQVEDEADGPD